MFDYEDEFTTPSPRDLVDDDREGAVFLLERRKKEDLQRTRFLFLLHSTVDEVYSIVFDPDHATMKVTMSYNERGASKTC